jgi:hypothetical protein
MDQNRSYREIVTQILREAEEIDRAEDELYGDARGDELPEQLRTAEGRREALAEAKRRLAERKGRAISEEEPVGEPVVDPALVLGRDVLRRGGRREWFIGEIDLPVGAAQAERTACCCRAARVPSCPAPSPASADRPRWRPAPPGGSPPADRQPEIDDPRDRAEPVMRTQGTPPRQSYNAQTAVNENQIIVAAEITVDAPDFGHLEPMLDTTLRHLHRHGVSEMPKVLLGDAGYWHTRQIQSITERGIEVLIPPDGTMREGKRPGWEHGLYEKMRRKLKTKRGRKLYAQRKITVEPVYGQIKYNRRVDRFMRRGRAAAQSEWRLVTATHNLLKLHSHWIANTA